MAASIAALILLPLSLTACGGDSSSASLDGEYYYFHNDTEGSQLVIDGPSAVFRDFDTEESNCKIEADDVDAQGTIDDEGTQIMWDPTFDDYQYIYDNKMEDDVSPVTSTTSGDAKVITVGGFAFTSDGPEACK